MYFQTEEEGRDRTRLLLIRKRKENACAHLTLSRTNKIQLIRVIFLKIYAD